MTLNLIFGYPGEEERHRRETLRVMGDIAMRFDNVTFSPNIFTPYPGIPIWPELKERGLAEPESLEAWADIDLGSNNLPWLRGRSLRHAAAEISYFLLDNQINKARRKSNSPTMQSALSCCASRCTGGFATISSIGRWNCGFRWRSNGWWCGARCSPDNP